MEKNLQFSYGVKCHFLNNMGLMTTPRFFLQLWGIWPVDTLTSKLSQKLYIMYGFCIIGWYSFFNIFQFIASIRLVLNNESFDRISRCISVTVTVVLMLVISLIYKQNGIPQLCSTVLEIEADLAKSKDEKVTQAYRTALAKSKYLNIYIVGSSLFTLSVFTGLSLLDVIKVGPTFWDFDNVTFMHELYLPFNRRNHQLLIITTNIFTACESVVVNGAIQTTFYALVMYGALRFKILRLNLKKIDQTEGDRKWRMRELIQDHQYCIRFVGELNQATKNMLLMSFVLNSLKVASVLFPLMAISEFTELAFPLIYSSMLVSEVVFQGWICNKVTVQSVQVAETLYDTFWYKESKQYNVLLQLMLMRAQRPLTMRIGPFGAMTTSTILTTMRAAYSYATLMMNSS